MRLIYLIGEPGVGKSTLMVALTEGCARVSRPGPVPHDRLIHRHRPELTGLEIGRRRERFSGTDALSMSIMPRAVEWITTRPAELVLAEGDRLASLKFWRPAVQAGYTVSIVACHADEHTVALRRADRNAGQSERWIAGRRTKLARLIEAASSQGLELVPLPCHGTVEEVASRARSALPVLKELT